MRAIFKLLCDIFDMDETEGREYFLESINDPEVKRELQEKLGVDEEQLKKKIEEMLRSIGSQRGYNIWH